MCRLHELGYGLQHGAGIDVRSVGLLCLDDVDEISFRARLRLVRVPRDLGRPRSLAGQEVRNVTQLVLKYAPVAGCPAATGVRGHEDVRARRDGQCAQVPCRSVGWMVGVETRRAKVDAVRGFDRFTDLGLDRSSASRCVDDAASE